MAQIINGNCGTLVNDNGNTSVASRAFKHLAYAQLLFVRFEIRLHKVEKLRIPGRVAYSEKLSQKPQ